MGKFYLTGDTHGVFNRILDFSLKMETTIDDVLIILGDVGVNYYLNKRDNSNKRLLAQLDLTLFCIKGNHEKYPETLPNYKTKIWNGGKVFYEEEFPNIIFAKDGEIYNFNGKECLVLGGAYSVDKFYRLERGYAWFEDEQPSDELKKKVNEMIKIKNKFDYVLSHTCPFSTMPRHLFLSFIDQSTVDNSTENWLQYVSENISFDKWYFGHYHDDWTNGKYHMLYNGYDELV